MELNQIIILVITGLVAGLFGGAFGLGGVLIVIPSLVFLLGMSQHAAQGTNIAFMLAPIGLLAAVNYFKNGMVNVKFAVILALTFFIGAYFGSKLIMNVPEKILKTGFGIVLILLGVKMMWGK